mmetsp:Transcript_9217/g.19995  ORF Transcript_9217/g.19995 Transcript_9217/m.19995 type:complete len:193 (-) Transcript_9217:461-1039(-)
MHFLWRYIVVLDCNYDPDTGKLRNIFFTTSDVGDRVKAAIDLSPLRKVQPEVDFFKPRGVHSAYHVGHVEFSDYDHFYWPLFYQIIVSENKEEVHQLLSNTIAFIEHVGRVYDKVGDGLVDDEPASVNVILADGGSEILATIVQLNEDLQASCNDHKRERLHCADALRILSGWDYQGEEDSLAPRVPFLVIC